MNGTPAPLLRGGRVQRLAVQLAFLAVLALVLAWLGRNLVANMGLLGIDPGFGFLSQPAGFDIAGSDFRSSETVLAAMLAGLRHTVVVSVAGIILATVLGLVVGIARLSPNWLLRRVGTMFVETFRNVPVLVIIVFMYEAVALRLPAIGDALRPLDLAVVSNRGIWVPWPAPTRGAGLLWGSVVAGIAAAAAVALRRRERPGGRPGVWATAVLLTGGVVGWVASGAALSVPHAQERVVAGGFRLQIELAALLGGLVLYTSSHVAEIVRASVLAVPKGQTEAAQALGLSPFQRLRLVVIPQALRIMVPPLANQFLNLTKNSSLGVAVGYAEVTLVTRVAAASGNPAPQAVAVLMGMYLALSLAIAAVTNFLNRRLVAAPR